jgi:hypothetical protein
MTTPPLAEQIELATEYDAATKTSALKTLLRPNVSSKTWALQIR